MFSYDKSKVVARSKKAVEIKKFHFNFLAALRFFCDTYAHYVVLS